MTELDGNALARSWKKVRSKPPHRLINPDHRIFEFEGPELKTLLRGSSLERARYVYGIGADGYVTMVPAEVIRRHDVILAFKRDGQMLTPTLGEQQIIFPTEGATAAPVRFREKSAFWAWYLRALVAGDLPNVLTVGRQQLDSRKLSPRGKAVDYVPPSLVRVGEGNCPLVDELPLSRVPGLNSDTSSKALNLYKEAMPLSPVSGYRLLRAFTSKGIPVECGGPFILIKPGRLPVNGKYGPDDLLYFVYGVDKAS